VPLVLAGAVRRCCRARWPSSPRAAAPSSRRVPALRRSIALVYRPGTLSPRGRAFRELATDVVSDAS
jgi:hypothetical protein